MLNVTKNVAIKEQSEELQVVYGIVYEPNMADSDGDYMTAETIIKAAHNFMVASREIDRNHSESPLACFPVESFIARKGDSQFPEGAWVLGVKIVDRALWEEVKSGKYKSFSLQATCEIGETRELPSRWVDSEGNKINPFETGEEG